VLGIWYSITRLQPLDQTLPKDLLHGTVKQAKQSIKAFTGSSRQILSAGTGTNLVGFAVAMVWYSILCYLCSHLQVHPSKVARHGKILFLSAAVLLLCLYEAHVVYSHVEKMSPDTASAAHPRVRVDTANLYSTRMLVLLLYHLLPHVADHGLHGH